jgi:hypothetical protein
VPDAAHLLGILHICIMNLVALRIPPGWAVTYNRFYEAQLDINPETGQLDNWHLFTNRLLNIHLLPLQSSAINHKHSLLIEVGWLPDGDVDGAYHVALVANTERETWQQLLQYSHLERKLIVDKMAEWMELVNDYRWGSAPFVKDEFSEFLKWFLAGVED